MTRKSPINSNAGSCRFRLKERLKGRNDIREVFGKGKRHSCNGAKLFVLKNDLPYNRICFTLSRGYGNAVTRNRARRLGREAFRLMKPDLAVGHDLILLVYTDSTPQTSSQEVMPKKKQTLCGRSTQLTSLFKKAGLLK